MRVVADDVYREGITGVTADDIRMAGRLGYVVKLLAVIDAVGGEVAVRVHRAPAEMQIVHRRVSSQARTDLGRDRASAKRHPAREAAQGATGVSDALRRGRGRAAD